MEIDGEEQEVDKPDIMLFNCALDIFSRMNDMALSSMTFEMMQNTFDIEPDECSYNALLKTTTDIQHGMDIFKQMMDNDNINANVDTFNALIHIHSKSIVEDEEINKKIVNDGVKLFYSMIKDYYIDANCDTLTILFNCASCRIWILDKVCYHL